MSLEDIERKFYSEALPQAPKKENPSAPPLEASERPLEPTPSYENLPSEPSPWASSGKVARGTSKILTFLVIAIVAGVAVGAAWWGYNRFLAGNATGTAASVDLYAPLQSFRGTPFEARIDIVNDETRPISGELAVALSSGLLAPDGEEAFTETVPSIEPGATYTKKFTLFAVGDVGSTERFDAVFSYGGAKIEASKEVGIKAAGLKISVEKEQLPSENALFDIHLAYENVSGNTFPAAAFEIRPPAGFVVVSSSAGGSGTRWDVEDLAPGEKGTISFRGAASSSTALSVRIPAVFSVDLNGSRFEVLEESVLLSAEPQPILVDFGGAGAPGYVGRLGSLLPYVLTVKNNSGIDLQDVVVAVKLDSSVVDFSKVEPRGGSFDSTARTISWAAAQVKGLKIMAPKAVVEIPFRLTTLPSFPAPSAVNRNFTVTGTVEATSPTKPQGSGAENTYIRTSFETKIAGDAKIEASAWRKDPGGIVNTGSMPLKVGKPTQYTVHWKIINYATTLKDVVVKSALEPGVKFTGVVKSSGGAPVPAVNDRTNAVEWKIPSVEPGVGVSSNAFEAVFQVEALPNETQLGKILPLTQKTTLTATDSFTGVAIQKSYEKITAEIPNDPTYKKGDEKVNP